MTSHDLAGHVVIFDSRAPVESSDVIINEPKYSKNKLLWNEVLPLCGLNISSRYFFFHEFHEFPQKFVYSRFNLIQSSLVSLLLTF